MTITTLDGLIAGTKQKLFMAKTAGPTAVAGGWSTLWAQAGVPAAGTAAATNTAAGTVLTSATTGAIAFQNPGDPATALIMNGQFTASQAGNYVLYDRIWQWGASTFVNGAYSTNNPAQSTDVYRPSTGENVEYWAEVTTVMSATAHTLTLTYNNQAGTTSRTATVTLPASTIVGRAFPFNMQAGDYGARRLTALSGSSVPTGAFNVVALRRVAEFFVPAVNTPVKLTATETGLAPLYDNSCLTMMYQAVATTALTVATLTANASSG